MKVHEIEARQKHVVRFWYDRAYRTWFAALFDPDGNQVGESVDAYLKEDIVSMAKDMAA